MKGIFSILLMDAGLIGIISSMQRDAGVLFIFLSLGAFTWGLDMIISERIGNIK